MLESKVENYLVRQLTQHGFSVPKLVCPGMSGVMDRLILRPKYNPGPPSVVEVKRPGETPRPLQLARADDWRQRGITVHDPVSTFAEVDELVMRLLTEQDGFC